MAASTLEWSVDKECAFLADAPLATVRAVLMLAEEHTVPFIVRYRQDAIGGVDSTTVRGILKHATSLQKAKDHTKKAIEKLLKSHPTEFGVIEALKRSTSVAETNDIMAPFKQKAGGPRTKAAAARLLGLAPVVEELLRGVDLRFQDWTRPKSDAKSTKEVVQGVKHILAEKIAGDAATRQLVKSEFSRAALLLSSSRTPPVLSKGRKHADAGFKKSTSPDKYRCYSDFRISLSSIKPHQILAINRGEAEKLLSVKIILRGGTSRLERLLLENWAPFVHVKMKKLLVQAISDACTRLILPREVRHKRRNMTLFAIEASVSVFQRNLRSILLARPFRNRPICAIDPGYKNGCKVAIINKYGMDVALATLYPFNSPDQRQNALDWLHNMLRKHNCKHVAIGNGTACRETEELVSNLRKGIVDLVYTIVNEAGASTYSTSKIAEEELPQKSPAERGAISIARRLQDPLSELVKIEPHHIGVGMYQHDVPEKLLSSALNDVVEDCVASVGVDLNSASESILQRVSGLNAKLAKSIISHKTKLNGFSKREQLLGVPGMGKARYHHAAGFLRVSQSENAGGVEVLDSTGIHPESYSAAKKLLKMLSIHDFGEIGSQKLMSAVRCKWGDELTKFLIDHKRIAEGVYSGSSAIKPEVDAPIERISKETMLTPLLVMQILEELLRPKMQDSRDFLAEIKFKTKYLTLDDIYVGAELDGIVRSETDFGAFVDIGVKTNGLLHSSYLSGAVTAGQAVKVKVISFDRSKKRIGLAFSSDNTILSIATGREQPSALKRKQDEERIGHDSKKKQRKEEF